MNSNGKARINDLLAEYAARRDQVIFCQKRADEIKEEILLIAKPGKYEKASVIQVTDKEIRVKGYIRRGYKAVRLHPRSKEA